MKADETPAVSSWETSATGLTGVWVQENTRESLFDAMARREVYATTGTRITVRVFAGWDFEADEIEQQEFVERGYKRGVPMGSDLSKSSNDDAPKFSVDALRDPDFDPEESAFYSVRVIEIPTPRWTAYDAKRFGVEMADEVRMVIQDRAYTSPIWYSPG